MAEDERQEIVLLDEDGEEHTFHLIEVVMVDEQRYALLAAAEEEFEAGDEDAEVENAYLFRIESDGDDERLVAVEDDDEFDRVAAALDALHDGDHDHDDDGDDLDD